MKKNYLLSVFAIMMAFALSATLVSCGGDSSSDGTTLPPQGPGTDAYVKVNGTTSTTLTFEGSFEGMSGINFKQAVAISSNVAWTVSVNVDWLSVSPSNGNGLLEMVIYPKSENESSTARQAVITLSGEGASATINVKQTAAFDSNLSVTPTDLVTLANGYACKFSFGSNVKYYYVKRYLPSDLLRKTDAEIIEDLSSDPSDRDTPSDNYVTSWQGQSPLTEYVICTVGYDNNGRHGALTKTNVKTKSGTNQAIAAISDVKYNDTYWMWTTGINGFVTKYYQWFISSSSLYNSTDAAIAWFFKREMTNNPSDFPAIAQGDTWYRLRNGGTIFHVATWAINVDGEFSGVIDRFAGSISNSSSIISKSSNNYDSSKRYKTPIE